MGLLRELLSEAVAEEEERARKFAAYFTEDEAFPEPSAAEIRQASPGFFDVGAEEALTRARQEALAPRDLPTSVPDLDAIEDREGMLQAIQGIIAQADETGETPFFQVAGNRAVEGGAPTPGFSRMPGNVARDYMKREAAEAAAIEDERKANLLAQEGAIKIGEATAKTTGVKDIDPAMRTAQRVLGQDTLSQLMSEDDVAPSFNQLYRKFLQDNKGREPDREELLTLLAQASKGNG